MAVAIRKLTQYGLKILREAPNETEAIRQLKEAHVLYLANPDSCRHTVHRDGGISDREQCTGKSAAKLWRKPLAKDSGGFGGQYGVGAVFKAPRSWKADNSIAAEREIEFVLPGDEVKVLLEAVVTKLGEGGTFDWAAGGAEQAAAGAAAAIPRNGVWIVRRRAVVWYGEEVRRRAAAMLCARARASKRLHDLEASRGALVEFTGASGGWARGNGTAPGDSDAPAEGPDWAAACDAAGDAVRVACGGGDDTEALALGLARATARALRCPAFGVGGGGVDGGGVGGVGGWGDGGWTINKVILKRSHQWVFPLPHGGGGSGLAPLGGRG